MERSSLSPRLAMHRRVLRVLSVLVVAAAALVLAPPAPPASAAQGATAPHEGETAAAPVTEEPAPGEKKLLSRLVAPCCWNQTLDIHGGAAPDQLRAELRARLRAGETPEQIERDMVARYGERVLAVPPGSPIGTIALLLVGLAIVAGGAVVMMLRRWRRAGEAAAEGAPGATRAGAAAERDGRDGRDAYDERLDEELRALD